MIYSLRHKQRSKVNVSTTDDSLILNASQLIDMQFFFLHDFISGTSASTKKPQTVKITFPLAFDKQPQNTSTCCQRDPDDISGNVTVDQSS